MAFDSGMHIKFLSFLLLLVLFSGSYSRSQPANEAYFSKLRLIAMQLKELHSVIISNNNELSTLTTDELSTQLQKNCFPSVDNYKLNRSMNLVELNPAGQQVAFSCETQDFGTTEKSQMNYVFTINSDNFIADIQVFKVNFTAEDETNNRNAKMDSGDFLLAVGVGVLASGIMAKKGFPGQRDKFLHSVIGSFIGSTATYIAHEKLGLSENRSLLVGTLTSVLVGLLKEVYDAKHPQSHTADSKDALATALGGGIGAFVVRVKFAF